MINLNNLKIVFITATDTGVGKSIFTAFLALWHKQNGKKVDISKPIQTGSPKDTDLLKELTGNKIPIFNTYDFSLPAAPSVAAKYENKSIEIEKIISDIRNLEKEFDVVIVEGIGGIAVPIVGNGRDHSLQIADLIHILQYPVVIVSRPSLGTINHTVLTIEYAKQKGLNILGFVISGYEEKTNDHVIKTAPDEITRVTNVKCLMRLPLFKEINYDSLVETLHATSLLSSKAPNSLANV